MVRLVRLRCWWWDVIGFWIGTVCVRIVRVREGLESVWVGDVCEVCIPICAYVFVFVFM